MMRYLWVVLLFAGCSPDAGIAIHGANESEAAVLRDVLERFSTELVEARLPTIRSITVVEPGENGLAADQGGLTIPDHPHPVHRIIIARGLSSEILPIVLRHELCHAMDLQSTLPSSRRDWPVLSSIPSAHDADDQKRIELFAYLCESGLDSLEIIRDLATSCVPDRISQVAAEIADEYFRPVDDGSFHSAGAPSIYAKWPFLDISAPELSARWIDDDNIAGNLFGEAGDDDRVGRLDLIAGTWSIEPRPNHGYADRAELQPRGADVPVLGWVEDVYAVEGRKSVSVFWKDLAWGETVSVVRVGDSRGTYADGCLQGHATARVRTHAIAAVESFSGTEWLDLDPLFNLQFGDGW